MRTRNIIIFTVTLVGAVLVIVGIIMVFNEINQSGVIDIKSAIISGKIESGSLGLLFSFLGVVLLFGVVLTKQ